MLRNSGMSPMPSGSSRQTSSVMPGRIVGLTMPTTPRQLENAICESFQLFVGAGDISFGNIAGYCCRITLVRVTVATGARALQQKTLACFHFNARRGRRFEFLGRADTHYEAGAAAFSAAGNAFWGKARLVETADDGRVLQQLVFALH